MQKMPLLLLFAFLSSLGLTGCHRTSDESRVREAVAAGAQAAEHVDASALDALLADDFDGNDGSLERRQLIGLLHAAAFRGETLHAVTGPVEVESRGERYMARFTVTLTSGGKLLPEHIGIYKVETAWRRDGRSWRCYSAHWEPMGG
jgi:hypothetical protein